MNKIPGQNTKLLE